MSKKTMAAWADISGDIHFEVFDGCKKTTWWMKGAESTSTRRLIGNAKLADMFREMAEVLEDSYQARKYKQRPETKAMEAKYEELAVPLTSAVVSVAPLEEKAKAVTVQDGKWFDRDDTETPFMLPNGKKDDE